MVSILSFKGVIAARRHRAWRQSRVGCSRTHALQIGKEMWVGPEPVTAMEGKLPPSWSMPVSCARTCLDST